ncbi:MAG: carbohydrate ABC transporter permease [Clostridia bacterium]|nr:carbohydrate ABC transporter permease [Clostridia bacterium]
MGIFMVLPMVYAISNSLKPLSELWIYPPQFFVENPTLSNFKNLFNMMNDSWVPFSRYLANTLFISIIGTFGHVILSSLCAYALAKHDFPGRNFLFKMVVFSLMFSSVVTAVPNFLIMAKLRLIDTHWSIILPAFASSLGLYLMKQFIEANIPDSLIEAAHIDGAGEGTVFFKVIMPLVKPAWLTLMIFSFQGLWGVQSTATIRSEELKTLSYALSQVVAGGIARQGASAAASVIMMIVPILVFVITQSNIVETVATSGMKD